MHKLMDLKEKLCKELEEYADKTEFSPTDLQNIDWMSHTVKSLATTLAMEGYSRDYEPDHSYDMRTRDDMGRYSRTYPMRNYSNGYSYGADSMMQSLKDMRANATSEKELMAIDRCINDMSY